MQRKSRKSVNELEAPSQSDLKIIINYVESNRQMYFNQMMLFSAYEWWHELSKTTMIGILLANCVHPADLEYLTINDYVQMKSIAGLLNEEMLQTLEPKYQKIVQNYYVIANNKTNTMLTISLDQKKSLDIIVKNRSKMRVLKENPYAFGLPTVGSPKVIKCCPTLRKYAQLCGALRPNLLKMSNLYNMKLSCRLLDTSVNKEINDTLDNFDSSNRLLTLGRIAMILLDINGFFGDNAIDKFKEFERKTIDDHGESSAKKRKCSEEDNETHILEELSQS